MDSLTSTDANVNATRPRALPWPVVDVPAPVLAVFRGIGQVFFQENALTGALFTLGIAISSPLMAVGAVVGSAIGTATGWVLKLDKSEGLAGIYGFNSALVGIATLFFFRPGTTSIGLLIVGCVVAALVTCLARRYVPFPTYTAPFIVTTWALFFLGQALGATRADPGGLWKESASSGRSRTESARSCSRRASGRRCCSSSASP